MAPGLGNFTVEADREAVFPVMEGIIKRHVETLWVQRKRYRARLFAAMHSALLAKLGTEAQGLGAMLDNEDVDAFLQRFRFMSLVDQGDSGLGPVTCAAMTGNIEVLRQLGEAKADMNEPFLETVPELFLDKGMTPLLFVLKYTGDVRVLEVLVELGAKLDVKDSAGQTALAHATLNGNEQAMSWLISKGAEVNEVGHFIGTTPVIQACARGHFHCLQLLLEHRASLNVQGVFGHRPLNCAAFAGSYDCCKNLLAMEVDVNARPVSSGLVGVVMQGGIGLARS